MTSNDRPMPPAFTKPMRDTVTRDQGATLPQAPEGLTVWAPTPWPDDDEKLRSNYLGRLRFRWKHEWAKVPSTRFAIKPFVVRHGLSLIYGEPKKAMKSTGAISMSCCLATGAPWCGFPVEKLRVLYVATEGFNGVLQRIEAWEQWHHRKVGNNLALLDASINFSTTNLFSLSHVLWLAKSITGY
jgi:hypothetical protein